MANTYTQIHIQIVFAVKYRQSLIDESWEDRLYQYMTEIIQAYDHKVLQINGMPDHIHVFIGMRPTQSLSALMQILKTNSSKWINEEKLSKQKFSWQGGYGAFTYARSQVPIVIKYIQNQKIHHQKQTFIKEFKSQLKKSEIDYKDQYLFHPPK